eukprot:scaffold22093_cov145-Isochrysis_galbana.AAC.2
MQALWAVGCGLCAHCSHLRISDPLVVKDGDEFHARIGHIAVPARNDGGRGTRRVAVAISAGAWPQGRKGTVGAFAARPAQMSA